MFTCQFGHHFKGSPRLILEGGHWCDECERKSWNYGVRAKKDQFFAQVWNPLHTEEELREYPKEVSELDVESIHLCKEIPDKKVETMSMNNGKKQD